MAVVYLNQPQKRKLSQLTLLSVTKSILLCHAHTVDLYRREYKVKQNGIIGITLNMDWIVPMDESEAAAKAAQQGIDHQLGMYAEPICERCCGAGGRSWLHPPTNARMG